MDNQQMDPAQSWKTACDNLALAAADIDFCDVSDAECDFYANAQLEALTALLMMQAPDHAALAYKLEQFIIHDCGELVEDVRNPILNLMLADTRRLGGLS